MRINRWNKERLRTTLVVGWLALAACIALPAAAAEKRLALVVGNARYPSAPLNNPENDARVVASTLRRLGFDVAEHVNLPVKDFRRVLREYAKRVQETEGTALFYYAGHGVQIDGRNYLLPVDINVRDEYEIKDEAVDVEELFVSRLDRARAQTRIIILDACRDNPFGTKTRGLRTVGTGLVEMGARGALIAYSSAPGATAEDGPPNTNSVFTRHMVKEMLVEGLQVEQMFKNVRVKVLRDTNQRQIPWLNTSLITDFSFNPRTGGDPAEAARRDDLVRLQSSLEKRDREQKEMEERIKRLSRELEQAQAASRPASGPPLAAREPPKPAVSVEKAPASAPVVVVTRPASVAAASPVAKAPAGPAPKTEARTEAKTEAKANAKTAARADAPGKPASPADAASARRHAPSADVKMAQAPANKVASARKGEGTASSERCVALLIRAQLGEQLAASDLSFLQKECR